MDFERLKSMSRTELRAYLDTLSFEDRMKLTQQIAANLTSQMLANSDHLEAKAEAVQLQDYEGKAKEAIERIRRM